MINHDKCTGCSACAWVCPRNCITMTENKEGFLYPVIDEHECVKCGKCERVCPVHQPPEVEENTRAYIAQSIDLEIRNRSASGGIFGTVATWIFERKGVVFGAAYSTDNMVVHNYAESAEELKRMTLCASKYVQSVIGDTYCKAKEFLECGRLVCFAGTPCQIAGLYSFLGKEYDNLILIDLVCHGVPSPKLYRRLLEYLESKYNSRVLKVNFRDKTYGYKNPNFTVTLENGRLLEQSYELKAYLIAFFNNISSRESCYQCSFKTVNRVSDLTLGDSWHAQLNENFDKRGATLVFSHSEKGERILKEISKNVVIDCVDVEKSVDSDGRYMVMSQKRTQIRDDFFSDIDTYDYIDLMKKYVKVSWKSRVLYKVRKLLKKFGFYWLKARI